MALRNFVLLPQIPTNTWSNIIFCNFRYCT